MEKFEDDFEERVHRNLLKNGIDFSEPASPSVGVAVSGGADSVSLLLSVSKICKRFGKKLYAVTVNHKIRPEAESLGDVIFVSELCEKIRQDGVSVELFTKSLEDGEVFSLSKKRKCGTEAAARFLRYKAFSEFKEKFSLDYVLLAHNLNDNLETILMRFLQGSSFSGIKEKRDFYVRALLDIRRDEIESYLRRKGFAWRTDFTNFDENYLRNKIRKSLVPLLNEKFSGWEKALLSGSKKSLLDEDFFLGRLSSVVPISKTDAEIVFSRSSVQTLEKSVLSRLVFSSLKNLHAEERIPFSKIFSFMDLLFSAEEFKMHFSNIVASVDKNRVIFKKFSAEQKDVATESSFFAIIERTGEFSFPFGSLNVSSGRNGKFVLEFKGCRIEDQSLPVLVRSRALDDRICSADGNLKKVSDILSDWNVPSDKRQLIPLVQSIAESGQKIKALVGSVSGYKNWIVRG